MTTTKPMSDQELDTLLAGLPEHQPKAELWQAIEPQLTVPKSKPSYWRQWQALAASVLVAAVALGVYWKPWAPGISQEELLSRGFAAQKSALVETLNAQRAESLVGDWQFQIQVMDAAVQQIKQSLRLAPEDPDLLRMLEHLYRQQIDFMQAIQPQAFS